MCQAATARVVLWLTAAGFVAALLLGHDVSDRLVLGNTAPIGAPSVRADELFRKARGAGNPDLVVIARGDRSVDSASSAAAGARLTSALTYASGVSHVSSYWDDRSPALRSRDGRSALLLVSLAGDHAGRVATARRLATALTGGFEGLTVSVTGEAPIRAASQERSENDLRTAELIAAPLTLAILLVVFGSVVAALLPVLVGALAVIGTMAALRLLTEVTEISVFALSIATALGFALAVDFSLFIVTRFREELAHGLPPQPAIALTMRTTGRAMAYSAVTVALCLTALLLFPFTILRSIAYGGITITVAAAVVSLLVLPAVLALLGERVNSLPIPGPWRAGRERPSGQWWFAGATAVMRRPLAVAVPTVLVLLALGVPFADARFATVDDRVLPPQEPAAQAARQLRRDFDAGGGIAPTTIVLPGLPIAGASSADIASLRDYARRVSAVRGVVRVDTAVGSYLKGKPAPRPAKATSAGGSYLIVTTAHEPYSVANSELAQRLGRLPSPAPALIGGPGANLADTRESLGDLLPLALTLVTLTTLALVTALTGSVVLALKALLMNALSLTATFGVLTWVFQDGHLRRLVGDFTVTGSLDVLMPSMIFCIAFGLSMDYEIFLLARITEEYRRTGDTVTAVALGLQHTGRLFTSAAVIFAVVMAALATSGLSLLKMVGVGLAFAVLLDATLIRALLVPAVMRLAGRANWWSPWPARWRDGTPAAVARP
ncbi:MMPL family transporter [Nonomuraea angiospora]|uniref:MMPL family transporter n=1 Tax=Nonomuraea angiospora TaxID=46172 RepID=UPI00344DC439